MTMAVRGEDMLRLCRAGRPKVRNSCGKNCSGGDSMRLLLRTGSNVDDGTFSLSSDECAENVSLAKYGVVGVGGVSSETSDGDVVQLIGVLIVDRDVRFGVTGSDARG